jgi:CheY-like chemotaxis protein
MSRPALNRLALAWIGLAVVISIDPAPDLIMLDFNISTNDGLEILSAMREAQVFEGVQVLVLTSSSSPRERAKLESLRIARHVTKPLEFDEFMDIGSAVKQVLARGGPAELAS